jgi:hypothetical protein
MPALDLSDSHLWVKGAFFCRLFSFLFGLAYPSFAP